jgi:hypothetical protein
VVRLPVFCTALIACLPAAANLADQPLCQVWVASAMQKVFQDEAPPASAEKVLRLSAARGEREAAQIVLRPSRKAQLVDVKVSDLQAGRGVRLEAEAVAIYQVAYIHLPAHGRKYPDPLPPLRLPMDLEPNQNQPLWISIEVPRDARPGQYRGQIELEMTGGERHLIPIQLRVWSFEIPLKPSMRTAFGLWGDGIARHHEVTADSAAFWENISRRRSSSEEEPPKSAHQKLMHRYWELLVSRRISPYSIPVDIFSPEAEKYLGDPRLSSFIIPYSDDEAQLRRTVDHLRQGGWLEKGYFYVVDEPITREQYDRLVEICQRIKRIDPSLKIVSPYFRHPEFDPEKRPEVLLDGQVNIWCPVTAFFQPDLLRERQQRGEEVWWYVCCGPGKPYANFFVDMDGIDHRILFWQQKMFGVQGLLYWNTIWWDPNSTQDPWEDIATVKNINPQVYGDGSLVYPGKRAGVYGPVTSIRLELICDGTEDYEYLTLYEKEFGENATQEAIRELTRSLTEFEKDPKKLEAVRDRIARALDARYSRRR